MAARRPAVPAIVEAVQRAAWEFDIQTVDRGAEHLCVMTNLFHEGQLVVTRKVSYAADSPVAAVREVMVLHHGRLLADLAKGALDLELRGVVGADATRLPGPSQPATPMPRTPLPQDPQRLSSGEKATVLFEPPHDGQRPMFTVVLQEPRAFLDIHYTKGHGGLVVETREEIQLGAQVDIAVRFLAVPIHQFFLTGVVSWRRRSSSAALKAGIGVDFPATQKLPLDRVVEFALGIHDVASDRAFPRVRWKVPVKLEDMAGRSHTAQLINLSEGGACLAQLPTLPVGEHLVLTLKRGRLSRTVMLKSRVQWVDKQAGGMCGVMFVHADKDAQLRVASWVAEIMEGG